MITREEKEQIFALYWGQCAMKETKFQNSPVCLICETFITECEQWHLELKPLASISNEDATEVAKKVFANQSLHDAANGHWYVRRMIQSYGDFNQHYFTFYKVAAIVDYLRSCGYAMPAFGHTVDELVKEGVFKLIEP